MENSLVGVIVGFDDLLECAILLNEHTTNPIDVYIMEDKKFLLVTSKLKNKIPKSFLIHKKESTFYTINALNQLICEINNGILDTSFKLEWHNYSNMLLLTNRKELVRYKLNFFKRI